MPTDFWRNEQMLNIFRTKPCQRLAKDGLCGWRSQCQFSHCLDWPRRHPRRHNYTPDVCPHLHTVINDGTMYFENRCTEGLRCPRAHSKEEVLFHPHIFKTVLCEEHGNATRSSRHSRSGKRTKCHRYYCPFAHGNEELQQSPLSEEQRERCIKAAEIFPSDICCGYCTRHFRVPERPQQQQKFLEVEGAKCHDVLGVAGKPPGFPGHLDFAGYCPQKPPASSATQRWERLSTVPQAMHGPPGIREGGFQRSGVLPGGKPTPNARLGVSQPGMPPLPTSSSYALEHLGQSPAFIDITDDGSTVVGLGQPKAAEPRELQPRELLGEMVYAML